MEPQEEIIEPTEEAPPEAPPEIASEITAEAIRTGWQPEEDFKGDKTRWRPADKWVERGKTLIPIINAQLRNTTTELESVKAELERQRKTSEKLVKMSETIGQQEYERAKRELTHKQVAAVSEGDVDSWQKLEDEKDKLTKPEPVAPEPDPEPNVPPEFKEWVDKPENQWFTDDEDLAVFANAYAGKIDPEGRMSIKNRCEAVAKKVKDVFPHKFTNPARENPSAVDTPSQSGTDIPTGKKTYADLPAEAKTVCNNYIKQGLFTTREKYVKSYFEEE